MGPVCVHPLAGRFRQLVASLGFTRVLGTEHRSSCRTGAPKIYTNLVMEKVKNDPTIGINYIIGDVSRLIFMR